MVEFHVLKSLMNLDFDICERAGYSSHRDHADKWAKRDY